MLVRSLALRTELGLIASRGRVIDRGDYLVVETPDDPNYFYGNLLVLRAAPQVGEVAYWSRRFAEELGGNPAIRHITFAWDDPTGATGARDELVAAGFAVDVTQVMTAAAVTNPAPAALANLAIRPLASDEVVRTAELAFSLGDHHDDTYRRFLQRRAAWHATLVTAGTARFWGALDGSELVASLGLVTLGAIRRYQDVQTAPAYRRRGLAATLLATAAAEATTPVVIIAEPDSAASRVYERVGLRAVERSASACRRPQG